MPKDTKSLGNNNASAWESRGVVIKKEGMYFDTPSCFSRQKRIFPLRKTYGSAWGNIDNSFLNGKKCLGP